MEENIVFDEIVSRSKQTSSQSMTVDELVLLAENIWKRVKKETTNMDEESMDEFLTTMQEEYKDFTLSFPLVLRWMVQARRFSSKAFRSFLSHFASNNNGTKEDFIKLQAEYLVILWKLDNARTNVNIAGTDVDKYRQSIVSALLEESKVFEEVQAQVEAELEEKKKKIDEERRIELMEFLKNRRDK